MNKFYQEKAKLGYPPIRSKWRSRKLGTRIVIDYDFGGRIVFQKIFANKSRSEHRESLEEWKVFEASAKRVD